VSAFFRIDARVDAEGAQWEIPIDTKEFADMTVEEIRQAVLRAVADDLAETGEVNDESLKDRKREAAGAKEPARRRFVIDGGGREFSPIIPGSEDDDENERVRKIRDAILVICGELGGTLIDEEREEFDDDLEDGETVTFLSGCTLEIEFPSYDSGRRADEIVRESYGMYGIYSCSSDSHHLVQFETPNTLDVRIQDSIREYIRSVCSENEGDCISSQKSPGGDIFVEDYVFETREQAETVRRKVRERYSEEQVKFGEML